MDINREGHTRSSLPDLLRHGPEDRQYLNHDLDDDVRHSRGRPDLYILFKPLEKVLQTAKQVHKSILASADILDGLENKEIEVSENHPCRVKNLKDTYLEENTNSSKNRIRRWEYLWSCMSEGRYRVA